MKTYDVYQHPISFDAEAVKRGFSWPAFFFTWIWAFLKKLPRQGAILLIYHALLLYAVEETGVVGSIGILLYITLLGYLGNGILASKLEAEGYQYVGTVDSTNREEAIDQALSLRRKDELEHRPRKKLDKSRSKKIFGVCAGIADYLGVDQTIVRVVFVITTVAFVLTLAIYVLLAGILYTKQESKPQAYQTNY